jgi:hypothetical protein
MMTVANLCKRWGREWEWDLGGLQEGSHIGNVIFVKLGAGCVGIFYFSLN